MLLFDIIGVDTTNYSFYIAFVFLNGEIEEDYNWTFK